MKVNGWFVGIQGVLALVACGSAVPAPGAAPSASMKEQTEAKPDLDVCGGFEQRALSSRKQALLGERLLITPIEGLEGRERPHDLMSAPAAAEQETRLFLRDHEHKLVVFSEEMFARPGSDLIGNVRRASAYVKGLQGEELKLSGGVRAALFVHTQLDPTREAVAVAHAFTVLPDDTLQVTHVFVDPSAVRDGSGGCVALARKLLGTLEAGTRRLDLSAGTRKLGNGYSLELPASFALTSQPGPDFEVFHVVPVRAVTQSTGQLGLYFGHHASFSQNPAAKKIGARLLGESVSWQRTQTDDGIAQDTLVEQPQGLMVHAFVNAPTEAEADELARIAATLKH